MPHHHSPLEGTGKGQDRTGELVLALFPEFVKAANRQYGCVLVPKELALRNWPLVCLLLRYGTLPPEERKLPELCESCRNICGQEELKEALVGVAIKLMVANSFNVSLLEASLHHLAEEQPGLVFSWEMEDPSMSGFNRLRSRARPASAPLRATAQPSVTGRC